MLDRMLAVKPFWDSLSDEDRADILTVKIGKVKEMAAAERECIQKKMGKFLIFISGIHHLYLSYRLSAT